VHVILAERNDLPRARPNEIRMKPTFSVLSLAAGVFANGTRRSERGAIARTSAQPVSRNIPRGMFARRFRAPDEYAARD
jgi:hypothetical protein